MSNGYDYRRFKVLFVDDEEQACEYFSEVFADDFDILTARSAEDAWRLLEQHAESVAVLISDQRMPGQQGVDLLSRVRLQFPPIVRILTTAYSDLPSAVAAVNRGGAFRYLMKPWDLEELKGVLLRAMEFFLVRRDRDRLLGEKLHVLQRLIVMDRVRALAVFAATLRCRLCNPLSAWKAYMRQAPLDQWTQINMGDAPQMDLAMLARTESENLLTLVHDVLWGTLPWGVEAWHEQLAQFHDGVDVEQIVCQVGERLRTESGRNPISLQVDRVPCLPRIRANPDLFGRLIEILLDRIRVLRPDDATVTMHLAAEPPGSVQHGIRLRLISEGPAWTPSQMSALFSAVVPTADWMKGMETDLLPAFLLAHHHSGTIYVHPQGQPGPALEVIIAADPKPQADEGLGVAWFDGVFSLLEEWPLFSQT